MSECAKDGKLDEHAIKLGVSGFFGLTHWNYFVGFSLEDFMEAVPKGKDTIDSVSEAVMATCLDFDMFGNLPVEEN